MRALTLVVPQIGDFDYESRGQGGHGEWPPSRAGPRATNRAQRRPSFHIGTRYTYTVEARSGHFEPDSARGGRNSTGLTEGIARARRGLGCLRRGRGMLGERSSEVGVSNAIEQLPACGRDGRPGEEWQWRVGQVMRAHAGDGLADVPWGRRQHTWAPISEPSR